MAFVVVLFVVDKAFLPLRHWAADRLEDPRVREVLDGEVDAELLVMGSSRGDEAIDAPLLEELTGLRTYSLAFHGSEIEFSTFLLRELLRHERRPRLIVRALDDPHELTEEYLIGFRTDLLYPLVDYPAARRELVARGEKDRWLSELFVLYQVGFAAFDFRRPAARPPELVRYGAVPEPPTEGRQRLEYRRDSVLDRSRELPEKIAAFREFERLCHDNGIPLVLALTPNFREPVRGFVERIRELSDPRTRLFVFNKSEARYRDFDYFNDRTHLNRRGAEIYTRELADYLSPAAPPAKVNQQ